MESLWIIGTHTNREIETGMFCSNKEQIFTGYKLLTRKQKQKNKLLVIVFSKFKETKITS